MNKHKSNKIKENSDTVRHLIMGQIITTQNLVAIKEVQHAGQSHGWHDYVLPVWVTWRTFIPPKWFTQRTYHTVGISGNHSIGHTQGWGQFHFLNSIPIPIPLFSIPIPIPIPLLAISFNSNSNSNSRDFNSNSNSNSGDLKSRQAQFEKWRLTCWCLPWNWL